MKGDGSKEKAKVQLLRKFNLILLSKENRGELKILSKFFLRKISLFDSGYSCNKIPPALRPNTHAILNSPSRTKCEILN